MIFHLIINKKSHLCQIGVLGCLFALKSCIKTTDDLTDELTVEITAGGNTSETSLEDGLQNSSGAGEEAQCAASFFHSSKLIFIILLGYIISQIMYKNNR